MAERDPRNDPLPGDMLRCINRERHVVGVQKHWYASGLGGKVVRYLDVRKRGSVGELRCSLYAWRKWAKSTEVVQWASAAKQGLPMPTDDVVKE